MANWWRHTKVRPRDVSEWEEWIAYERLLSKLWNGPKL